MELTMPNSSVSKQSLWAGRVISALAVLFMLFDGVIKLMKIGPVTEAFAHLGYPETLAISIGILELVCTAVYVIPRTSLFGALLLTGFLGGAVSTHVRVGDPFFFPFIIAAMLWGGLYLTDSRLRLLLAPQSS